jgi:dTDP-4-amino-4,6-dideoxygalactose transaminase
LNRDTRAVGIIAVHVGGMMMNVEQLQDFARREGLWIVEDAAHAFPAAWRNSPTQPWQRCGKGTAEVSCFSFYANKTITTGEGGMAVTNNAVLASRMRMMSLHGLSQDAWDRYSTGGTWDYKIAAPGFKYNLTDIAASIGIHQLARAERMRKERESIAHRYLEELANLNAVELPRDDPNRIHSWHLFPIKLRLNRLTIDRNAFVEELKRRGVGCSVHWRPLHLHPYYEQTFGWRPESLPVATAVWQRLISLPLFPGMDDREVRHVVDSVAEICGRYAR